MYTQRRGPRGRGAGGGRRHGGDSAEQLGGCSGDGGDAWGDPGRVGLATHPLADVTLRHVEPAAAHQVTPATLRVPWGEWKTFAATLKCAPSPAVRRPGVVSITPRGERRPQVDGLRDARRGCRHHVHAGRSHGHPRRDPARGRGGIYSYALWLNTMPAPAPRSRSPLKLSTARCAVGNATTRFTDATSDKTRWSRSQRGTTAPLARGATTYGCEVTHTVEHGRTLYPSKTLRRRHEHGCCIGELRRLRPRRQRHRCVCTPEHYLPEHGECAAPRGRERCADIGMEAPRAREVVARASREPRPRGPALLRRPISCGLPRGRRGWRPQLPPGFDPDSPACATCAPGHVLDGAGTCSACTGRSDNGRGQQQPPGAGERAPPRVHGRGVLFFLPACPVEEAGRGGGSSPGRGPSSDQAQDPGPAQLLGGPRRDMAELRLTPREPELVFSTIDGDGSGTITKASSTVHRRVP